MLRKRLFRILFGPLKKVSATLINIIAFDVAMTVYRRAKVKFTKAKPEKEEDEIVFIRPKYKRKRGGL